MSLSYRDPNIFDEGHLRDLAVLLWQLIVVTVLLWLLCYCCNFAIVVGVKVNRCLLSRQQT